jgi:hypothetical protein
MARSGAERGPALTNELLAFARCRALDPKATDTNVPLAGLAMMPQRTLGEHVEIVLAPEWGVLHALVDPGQLANAIRNLCITACETIAMPTLQRSRPPARS